MYDKLTQLGVPEAQGWPTGLDIKDTVTIECLKRIIIPLRPVFGGSCKVESN